MMDQREVVVEEEDGGGTERVVDMRQNMRRRANMSLTWALHSSFTCSLNAALNYFQMAKCQFVGQIEMTIFRGDWAECD